MTLRPKRSLSSWLTILAALPALAMLSAGCGRSQAPATRAPQVYHAYPAGYSGHSMAVYNPPVDAGYGRGRAVVHSGPPPSSAPVASAGQVAPADTSVSIVRHSRGAVHGVTDSLGYEELSTGEKVTVVTYVHHYPEAIETYPSLYWSGRLFYNIHGNLVFWDPFWNSWAYYWGPPQPLIGFWNLRYPWMAYSWGTGFYGPGWYWGGVSTWGFHGFGRAPIPVASNGSSSPATSPAAQGRPIHNARPTASGRPIQDNGRPIHNARPTASGRPIDPASEGRPVYSSHHRATGTVRRIHPGRSPIVNHNPQGGRATAGARITTTHVPTPSAVIHSRPGRPSYQQPSDGRRVFSTREGRPVHGAHASPGRATSRATVSTRHRGSPANSRAGRPTYQRWNSTRPSSGRPVMSRPSYRPASPSFHRPSRAAPRPSRATPRPSRATPAPSRGRAAPRAR